MPVRVVTFVKSLGSHLNLSLKSATRGAKNGQIHHSTNLFTLLLLHKLWNEACGRCLKWTDNVNSTIIHCSMCYGKHASFRHVFSKHISVLMWTQHNIPHSFIYLWARQAKQATKYIDPTLIFLILSSTAKPDQPNEPPTTQTQHYNYLFFTSTAKPNKATKYTVGCT